MPFIDTSTLEVIERLPGLGGTLFSRSQLLQRENSYPQNYPQTKVPTVLFSDLAAPARM
jgi:hypothetical protein